MRNVVSWETFLKELLFVRFSLSRSIGWQNVLLHHSQFISLLIFFVTFQLLENFSAVQSLIGISLYFFWLLSHFSPLKLRMSYEGQRSGEVWFCKASEYFLKSFQSCVFLKRNSGFLWVVLFENPYMNSAGSNSFPSFPMLDDCAEVVVEATVAVTILLIKWLSS